ncbi:exported hypothetical protein [Candidatus Sulfopaludibacter sp. SbA3]|nr:exported hypothetical protein [Candidatus Sulfopaludibacter sp. SbA3]
MQAYSSLAAIAMASQVPLAQPVPLTAAVSIPRSRSRRLATPQCAILAALCLHAADDPNEIVRRALQLNQHNSELARQYTYIERQENRTVDNAGVVKRRESSTWDVTLLDGSSYRRLIQRNDKPLTPKDEADQLALRKKRAEMRRKETPEERQKRLDARERARKQQQDDLNEVPDALDLRIVGEEQIDGMPVWVIEGAPRKDYKPKSKEVSYFSKMKGRIWISKSDYQPVKIEAETIDTISMGAFLARVHKAAFTRASASASNSPT